MRWATPAHNPDRRNVHNSGDNVLRNDTPEEHVRQRVARSLVEEYGYDRADIHLEFPVKTGSGAKKRVDIAIFPPGQPHNQENIFKAFSCITAHARRPRHGDKLKLIPRGLA